MLIRTMKICYGFLCLLLMTSTTAQAELSREYTVGVVPQFDQRKIFSIWRPILDELELRTQLKFKLQGSATIPVFEKELLSGNYDFAYMNPYHLLAANNKQGYRPLVRDGGRRLKGLLVVKKNSPIKKVEQLNGKSLAFPAPNALGASLLMRADLKNLFKIDFIPRYVKTHSSVYLHVAIGLTAAGGGVTSTLNAQKEEVKKSLRIIYETRSVAPHPFTAHPRVSMDIQKRVQQAFLSLAETSEGQILLSKIPMKKVVLASMDDYQEISHWGLEKFWVD